MPTNSSVPPTNIENLTATTSHPITLQFLDISYHIKPGPTSTQNLAHQPRTIVNKITGLASPAQLLAILGPSGSGKSTFLSILSGRFRPHSGQILANGSPLTKSIIKRIGFVPQDDVLHPNLTVRETLFYCAMLRLPKTLTKAEKVQIAESAIEELGLGKCTDTKVRMISGGERRRVAIAHEMLTNPSVLILDEPTSGLDSTAAGRLVATLAVMARKGRTVVMVVHQPSSGVYRMFDAVMVLSEGSCVYFGEGKEGMEYFERVGFPSGVYVNPADFMLDLANGCVQVEDSSGGEKRRVKQCLVSSYNQLLASKVKDSVTASVAVSLNATARVNRKEKKNQSTTVPWHTQFTILLERSLKERKPETFNSFRITQVVAASLLAGAMWYHSDIRNIQDRFGLLFFISIFWGVFASVNSTFTFPTDRPILAKELTSRMYALSSYYVARTAGDVPMELVLPTVFTFVVYFMAGLRAEVWAFFTTVGIVLGYVMVAQGLGLAVGAAVMDAKRASVLVMVTMLAFLLTGGFYVQNVPSGMGWVKYCSFTFYCYRLLIAVQYGREEVERYGGGGEGARIVGQVGVGASAAALVGMFVGYRVLAYLALRRIKV